MLRFKFSLLFLIIVLVSSCDETTPGCIDSNACNFNSSATEDDGSCNYARENFDCSDTCLIETDCRGECGGPYILDECDECVKPEDAGNSKDCAGVCNGTAEYDCFGECGGTAAFDDCGICDGTDYYTNGLLPNGACNCWAVEQVGIGSSISYVAYYQYEDEDGCNICGGDGIDCNGECCSSWHEERCKVMTTGTTQTPPFNQTTFCEEQFTNDPDLESECKSFTNTDQVDGTLESFCELHFGCAQISEANDCNPDCTGGSTGLPYYDICGCFDSEADNYWCNDGGECPAGGTPLPLEDFNCQIECLNGPYPSGADGLVYQSINPAEYDNGFIVNNDLESCQYIGCTDPDAANYDESADIDSGDCQNTNYIRIGENSTNSTIEILINSTETIGGFQFSLPNINLGEATGGVSEVLDVSTGNGLVFAFSITGETISPTAGEQVLTTINYTNRPDICLADLIISDPLGGQMPYIIHYGSTCP